MNILIFFFFLGSLWFRIWILARQRSTSESYLCDARERLLRMSTVGTFDLESHQSRLIEMTKIEMR